MNDKPVSRYALGMTLAAALLGWMFDGFEMGLFPLVARPALRELMGPEAAKNIGTWFSVIIAMFLVGAACGGILFGWLGDRIGLGHAKLDVSGVALLLNLLCGGPLASILGGLMLPGLRDGKGLFAWFNARLA